MWGAIRCFFFSLSLPLFVSHTYTLSPLFFLLLFFKVSQLQRNIYSDIKRVVQVSGPNRARSRFSNYFLSVTFACDPTVLLLSRNSPRSSVAILTLFLSLTLSSSFSPPAVCVLPFVFPRATSEYYGRREKTPRYLNFHAT